MFMLLCSAAVVFATPEWYIKLFYHGIYFSLQTSEIMLNNLGKQKLTMTLATNAIFLKVIFLNKIFEYLNTGTNIKLIY